MAKSGSGINRTINIPQPNIFGRMGTGFGQGLAEQIPKEVQRNRVASGLEAIGKDTTLSPYQQAARLQRAGADNETISTFLPLLQQQNQQQEYLNYQSRAGKTGVTPAKTTNAPTTATNALPASPTKETKSTPGEPPRRATIVTPASSAILGEAILPPSQEEIEARTADYLRSQPNKYRGDSDAARVQAEKDLNIPYQTKVAEQNAATQQVALKDKFDNDFKSYISTQTQKEPGNFSDISGEQLNNYIAQAEDDFASKRLSKEGAIRKYGDEALDFAKKKQNLKTIGATWMVNKDAKDNLRSLKEIRKVFKTPEQKKELENLLESEWNLSPAPASYLAHPIDEHKELNNFVVKEKNQFNKNKKYFDLRQPQTIENERRLSMDNSIKNLSKVIKPGDSPLAISQAMKAAGYDPGDYFRGIQDAFNRGELPLVKEQIDEFAKQIPVNPSLNDLFYFGMLGLNDLVEQQ